MRGLPAIILCLFLARPISAQKLQDFAGTWRIDPDKVQEKVSLVESPPGNSPAIPPPPPSDHKFTPELIRQSEGELKISGGEAGTTAVYTIDLSGKQVSDPIPDAPGCVRIATSRRSDGKIVTEWRMDRDGQTFMHGTDTRSLTPGGQQIVERLIESPRHKAQVRLVMDRVP
jgi:hypothetical protein